jgi:hypothetical protein
MSFYAIKHGLHIAVHVFQINAIYGILIGIALASIMAYIFRSLFARADRQHNGWHEDFEDETSPPELNEDWSELEEELMEHHIQNCVPPKAPKPTPADRANSWYVGLNDDRSNPKKS